METLILIPDLDTITNEELNAFVWQDPQSDYHTLRHLLMGLSNSAMYMIYIGCINISMQRLGETENELIANQASEAAFAVQFDWRYYKPYDIYILDNAILGFRSTILQRLVSPFVEYANNLKNNYNKVAPIDLCISVIDSTLQILGNEKSFFDKWLQAILERLQTFAPNKEKSFSDFYDAKNKDNMENTLLPHQGKPLPYEILKLDWKVDNYLFAPLSASELTQINYKDNIFLQTPKEMMAQGFTGVPYTN